MDHKEEHHLRHEKEREHEKKEREEHERAAGKSALPFHPAWLAVAGVVVTLLAVLLWTIFLS